METGAEQATETTKDTPNGKVRAGLAGVDNRTSAARRFRELVDGYLQDAGDFSESAQCLARRAAAIGIWLEAAEAKLVNGGDVDIDKMTTAANAQRRLLENLGVGEPRTRKGRHTSAKRRAAKPAATLAGYLASKSNTDQ